MMINLGAEFGTHLESSEEVMFVTMNFAQAYYTAKLESDKKISEINLSDEVKVVMGAADEACNP